MIFALRGTVWAWKLSWTYSCATLMRETSAFKADFMGRSQQLLCSIYFYAVIFPAIIILYYCYNCLLFLLLVLYCHYFLWINNYHFLTGKCSACCRLICLYLHYNDGIIIGKASELVWHLSFQKENNDDNQANATMWTPSLWNLGSLDEDQAGHMLEHPGSDPPHHHCQVYHPALPESVGLQETGHCQNQVCQRWTQEPEAQAERQSQTETIKQNGKHWRWTEQTAAATQDPEHRSLLHTH